VFGGAAGFTYDDATGQVAFTLQADVASGNAYSFAGADAGELTAASGVQPFVSVTPRIRHTGTASWIGLYVNPTVISSGSGAQVAAAFMGGNVGIGTSTPAHKLTVRTPASDYGVEHTDGNARLSTYVGGSTGGGWLGTISNHKLSFFVNDQSASMTVDTTGNVGIGTTAPASKLSINGGISAGTYYGTAAPSGGMIISGNVGIGTASPTSLLHVVKTGATSGVDYEAGRFDTSGAGNLYLTLGSNATGGGYVLYEKNNAVIRFGTHQNTGYFARFSTSGVMIANNANSDVGGSFDGALLVRPMAAGTKGLVIKGYSEQTADLMQWQNSAGTVLGVINSSGNVGIGTAGPVSSGTGKLHMAADTFRLDTARTPASAAASGNAGEFCWDASYLYVCIAAATWRRLAHNTW